MSDPDAAQPPFDIVPEPLCIAGLAVARGGVPVLAGLEAEVAPGEALILRGPNGSGKTTLLRTLAGLQPPADGIVAPGADAMAYASHADGIKATLTVQENLRFWARIHGHAEIAPALAAFDLAALADRPAAALSAGQKRRLGLARMVLTRRPVWLFDEPTVSLDRDAVARFATAVTAHLRRGGLAVIATHIDLGLPHARTLDVTPFRATALPGKAAHAADAFGDDDGSAYL
ncbi:heme ABC exporter ATP-binding protein CcmA [Rhodovulum sp. 12E13]|uniref:heme ABC exporter ATP-binding protein CcmA n=1 Tax=Rhodovulum sp. 12E13 TaxID=2203891 RepID=UPI000E198C2D|nr:heme ABC exporter ATP-binding protein CcmA [Rhodovulum sp. 12E13]RDC73365.1 heme ABC exporter ATP-binding protein CcmA [Rhodovulum sp. 12E13]